MLEVLERLEDVYRLERESHRIKFRVDRYLAHAAFATNYGDHCYLISVRGTLPTDLAVEAAGMCVARIVLGHEFKRMGYREEYRRRELWREAFRWLGRKLITDRMISRMQRNKLDRYDLAELAGTTDHLTEHRIADWMEQRGELVTFPVACQEVLDRALQAHEAMWCQDYPLFSAQL